MQSDVAEGSGPIRAINGTTGQFRMVQQEMGFPVPGTTSPLGGKLIFTCDKRTLLAVWVGVGLWQFPLDLFLLLPISERGFVVLQFEMVRGKAH